VLVHAGLIPCQRIKQWTFYKRDEAGIARVKRDFPRRLVTTVMPVHIGIVACSAEGARSAIGPYAWKVRGFSVLTRIPRSRCTRTRSPST
jgi:hypothetical protein